MLDEFVLEAAKSGQPDICSRVIDTLRQAGVDRPGFDTQDRLIQIAVAIDRVLPSSHRTTAAHADPPIEVEPPLLSPARI